MLCFQFSITCVDVWGKKIDSGTDVSIYVPTASRNLN